MSPVPSPGATTASGLAGGEESSVGMIRDEGTGENRARRTSEELRGVFGSEELVLGGVSPCVIRDLEDKT